MAPRLLPILLAGLLLTTACVEPAPELGSSENAIVNGAFTSGDDAVVALMINNQQFCTGTLVTPTMVVTAAHCLPPHVSVDITDIDVAFGPDVAEPTDLIAAAAGEANPDWTESLVPNDVGVIALSRPALVLPVPMLAQPLDWMDPVGQRVRVVGYGITSASGTGNGRKRVGEMEITSVDDSNIYLAPGPASTCSGDSGGALLMDVFGIEFLAGIHSRSNCEDTSINERVDVHAQTFILQFIEGHGENATCDTDGLCAAGCDEPDPDCLCTGDGFCSNECPALDTDPDCSADCGADDGVCPDGCPTADPDCGDGSDVGAGCHVSDSSSSGSVLLLLLALVAGLRRRRRFRRRR